MKLSYEALMTAVGVLRLDAIMTSKERRRELLEQVADALLAIANGGGVIDLDPYPLTNEAEEQAS